jgi:hypothetical protein
MAAATIGINGATSSSPSLANAGLPSPSSSSPATVPALVSTSSGAPALTAAPRPSLTTAPRPVFIPRDELVVLPALPADPRYTTHHTIA